MTQQRSPVGSLPETSEVVIVGGNIAGPVMARALALAGRQVTVVERRPTPDARRLAGEMMMPRGARVLAKYGYLDRLRERGAVEVRGFACWRGPDAEPLVLDFAPRDDGQPNFGMALHHHEMVEVLQEGARRTPGVAMVTGQVTDVIGSADRIRGVMVKQGKETAPVHSELVVGCDGRHSKIRKHMGVAHTMEQPSMSIGILIPRAALVFPDRGHVFLGGWGPCLAYPIGREDARVIIDYPITGKFGDALGARLEADHFPVFPEPVRSAIMEAFAAGKVAYAANHFIDVEHKVVPGAALAGDAAGTTHPLTAAGMSVSFHDGQRLAEAVGGRGPIDLQRLHRYEVSRYLFTQSRHLLGRALYEVFCGQSAGAKGLQAAVFDYWQTSEAGREATMGLLACDTSSPLVFAEQYVRVMTRAALQGIFGSNGVRTGPRGEFLRSLLSEGRRHVNLRWSDLAKLARKSVDARTVPALHRGA